MKQAILTAAMVMAVGSTSALAAPSTPEGGQLTFHGLVSPTTCSKIITSERGQQSTDGDVYLLTAAPADVTAEVQSDAFGAKPEPFTIALNCKGATGVTAGVTKASLTMDSAFRNTKGTLSNDTSLTVNNNPAAGNVDIAIHDADTKAQVKVDGTEVHLATFNTDSVATYNFMASYVKSVAADQVTPGHVTTLATYSFTYE